jgi:hypothetical protein
MAVFKHKSTQDWKPGVQGHLLGVCVERGSLLVEGKQRPFVVIEAQDGFWRVYESAALDDVFTVIQPGDWTEIEFLGKVAVKGGKVFNRFKASVWSLESGEAKPFEPSKLAPKPVKAEEAPHAEEAPKPRK